MSYEVQFCNYPERYPAAVRDIAYLRSEGLLTLGTFYSLMRLYGITRTRALIFQGCVERKEYTIYDEEGREIDVEEVHDKLLTKRYGFVWMLKMKYTKRKHHQIHIELTVEGEIEKHEMFIEPTQSSIEKKVNEKLEEAFEEYLKAFWHILVRNLKRLGELDEYKPDFERFEEIKEYYKKLEDGLEGEIVDITFNVKRTEEAEWRSYDYYAGDFQPFAERAITEVADWILEREMDFLRREIEEARVEIAKTIVELRAEAIKRRIERAEKVVDVKAIEKDLEDALRREDISAKDYKELKELLMRKATMVFADIAMRWCKRIRNARTEGELNRIMKRIQNTYTWKNEMFEPFRERVYECERERRNELLKEAIRRKEITRERALKRVEAHFRRRKEEIMKTTRKVRDLRRLISRIRRSALSEKKKEELIKLVENNIEKIQKERCERAWKTVETETDIVKLRMLYYTIGPRRQDYEPCYDEIRKAIRSKVRKLRREAYRRRVEDIVSRFKESETMDRIVIVNTECSSIIMLPISVQYRLFRELIPEVKNRTELSAVINCLKGSPIYREPKYAKYRRRLDKMIEEKKTWLV